MTESTSLAIVGSVGNMADEPKDLTIKTAVSKKLRPIPPPLNLSVNSPSEPSVSTIASSPKSSIAQKNLPFRKRAHSTSEPIQVQPQPTHPNAHTPLWTIPASFQTLFETTPCAIDYRPQDSISFVSSDHRLSFLPSVLLSPAPSSVGSSREELLLESIRTPATSQYSSPLGLPVWHCFMSGSKIKLPARLRDDNLNEDDWRLVDDLPLSNLRPDWPGKLTVEQIYIIKNDWKKVDDGSMFDFRIKFSCYDGELQALCYATQLFFTQDNNWCCLTVDRLAKNIRLLQIGDVCLPPTMIQSSQFFLSSLDVSDRRFPFVPASPDICDRMQRFSFPTNSEEPLSLLSPPTTPTRATQAITDKAKRPMNAFMLFAKRYRLELIQSNPSKDNSSVNNAVSNWIKDQDTEFCLARIRKLVRYQKYLVKEEEYIEKAISVLLGEAWRRLPQADKDIYINEARSLAHHQKLLHPDCWKRKRSHSTS